MKKCMMYILAASMLLGLCACAPGGNESTTAGTTPTTAPQQTEPQGTFMAGFAQANITPDFSVPLAGYGNQNIRKSTGILNYIYASVLAVRGADGNTAILIGADLMLVQESYAKDLAKWCEQELDIPASNVIISAAHQHSTPYITNEKYRPFADPLIKKAIKKAVEDLAPAQMYINSVEVNALNFVRHYWNAEGKIYTPNHGEVGGGLVKHESDADNEMQLLKFKRGDGKKDIIVVNFQTHPYMSTGSTKTNISADWIGVLRDEVAKKLDCNVMYFSGAGGNLEDVSQIPSEKVSKDFKDHGKRAADYIIKADDSYTKVETGNVKVKQVTITYKNDHSMDHLYDAALPIYEELNYGDFNKAKQMAADHPAFYSVYHANYVVIKKKAGPTTDMTISAISIGDVAFTAHPYEMFDTNGMELKKGTVGNPNYNADEQLENPYKMTIVTTIANGYNSYIPSKLGYTNGGYSTDTARFEAGTGERVVGDVLKILNELHK